MLVSGTVEPTRGRRPGRKPPASESLKRRESLRRFPWPALFWGPFAVVMVSIALVLTAQQALLDREGIVTDAVVVGVRTGLKGTVAADVEFVDVNGQKRLDTIVPAGRPSVGDVVSITYTTAYDGAVRLNDEPLAGLMWLALFWFVAVVAVVGLVSAVRRRRFRR